jgi:hypothetical protein
MKKIQRICSGVLLGGSSFIAGNLSGFNLHSYLESQQKTYDGLGKEDAAWVAKQRAECKAISQTQIAKNQFKGVLEVANDKKTAKDPNSGLSRLLDIRIEQNRPSVSGEISKYRASRPDDSKAAEIITERSKINGVEVTELQPGLNQALKTSLGISRNEVSDSGKFRVQKGIILTQDKFLPSGIERIECNYGLFRKKGGKLGWRNTGGNTGSVIKSNEGETFKSKTF